MISCLVPRHPYRPPSLDPAITRLAHQVTGAVGYYTKYPLELYTRRALAASVSFGGVDYHARRLADGLW